MPGTILGTPSYMAPEQASGGTADRSADVWAFGCVVYEMLTGRRALAGSTVSEILANVLKAEPDYRPLPDSTPESVRRLLHAMSAEGSEAPASRHPRRASRDRRRRWRGSRLPHQARPIADRSVANDWPGRRRLALAVLVAGGLAVRTFRPAAAPPEIRFEIQTPPGLDASLAISPDGLKIVYTGLHEWRVEVVASPAGFIYGDAACRYRGWIRAVLVTR